MTVDRILERLFGTFAVAYVVLAVIDGWQDHYDQATFNALMAVLFVLLENQCRHRREDFRDNGEDAL